ncbi:MAG: hypothetical protein K0R78_1010 [Pelosinus sp.]|jgi:hypothetical protein|nr:hypothetical protein [Pelosinus sp.]
MITKVSRIYPADVQKHDNPQFGDGTKKKQRDRFKEILTKMLMDLPIKPIGFKG